MPTAYLDAEWLSRPSTEVAPELIGCLLVRQLPDQTILRGLIVETEAYTPNDPAMHAYRRRTARNQVIFGAAGHAYIYRIYGSYHCLNIVTDQENTASSVLIRALQLESIPDWIDAARAAKPNRIAAGPSKLCLALQIDLSLNGTLLQPGEPLWLEPRRAEEPYKIALVQTTRIGLTQGVELPQRWYLSGCPAVSKTVRLRST
ncbi:MAG: DNA-3-methyladenine glycosylase [Pegethrix bostrychoides GSE-TBD4-15B]|jgi:DNA-3-methyladenine glycosylase|uniref:Putative 3-methyladenine DNA glycosylase n=1 Tax=Pegethrix bostrychoides GSE-TBD4-15B TaxID=2839662 RepID=A0A951U3L3_9CYAN|nr:DNA-3-methyladenine glycosylase [Pegethrix bostrychoides GSE-TBD4-15B]